MQNLFQSIQLDVDLGIVPTFPKVSLRIMCIFVFYKFSVLNPFQTVIFTELSKFV